jgi:hypothetical protein
MPDRQDAPRDPGSGELLESIDPAFGDLRRRLDQLQRSVEQLGLERPEAAPAGAADRAGAPAAPAALAVGPIAGLVELRLLEEAIAELSGVAGVRVRWFGRRWARIDVSMSDSGELGRALLDLGRPIDLEAGSGELLIARFADVGGPSEPVPPGARLPAAAGAQGSVDRSVAQSLPEAVCRHFLMVPIASDGATLTVAVVNPADRLARDVAAALTGAAVAAVPTTREAIEEAIAAAFSPAGEPEAASPAAIDDTQRLADDLGIPVIDLEGIEPTGEALELLPRELQRTVPCVPLAVDDEALYLAIGAPLGSEAAAEVGAGAGGRRVSSFLAPSEDLEALLDRYQTESPDALRSPPPTAFPGRGTKGAEKGKRRPIAAVPLAVWGFLRAPVPLGVVLILVGVLVYLYLGDHLP